ncbi:MAG: SpoIIE family protein phosphatase [Bacteroidetes bacterium]|nr:SpoIIE family protein phosphatase [Bacteroidota bacterium]
MHRPIFFPEKFSLLLLISLVITVAASKESPAQTTIQQKQIDSLSGILNDRVHDTIRLKTLNRLARLFYTTQPDKGLEYAWKALELCRTMRQPEDNYLLNKEWALAHQSMAVCYYIKGEHPPALDYFFKAISLFEDLCKINPGDKGLFIDLARTYANAGNIFGREKNNEKSLEFFFKALSLFDKAAPMGTDVANTYINIGNIYKEMSKNGNEGELISKAMDYYFKALKIAEKIHDNRRIASCYTNIGTLYALINNHLLTVSYLKKALELHKKTGNNWGVAYTLLSLGQEYVDINKPDSALEVLYQAAAMAREMGAKKETAHIYEIIAYADTAMAINSLSSSAWWQKAFRNFHLFKKLNDSILNEENLKSLAKAEAKFEYDKKLTEQKAGQEKERLLAEEEARRKNIILISTVIILLLAVIFSFYLYTRFRIISKQKNIIQNQNSVLEQANREITGQKQLIQEKNKDITDSIHYASRIQRVILPSEEEFSALLPDSFIFYRPRDIVSGDFYWIAKIENGKTGQEENEKKENIPFSLHPAFSSSVILACCDCTGHGVPGALMSMVANDQLTHIVRESPDTTPARILEELDARIRRILHTDESGDVKDGLDISLVKFNPGGVLSFSGANLPLFLLHNGELSEYKPARSGIGGIRHRNMEFLCQNISLQAGDRIYLLTDGLFDQFGGEENKKFSKRNFRELLLSMQNIPVSRQHEKLRDTFENWKGSGEQTDDVTVIGIRI